MWVKFEVIPSEGVVLYLPSSWPEQAEASMLVQFGYGHSIKATVQYTEDLEHIMDSTYDNPEILRISYDLYKKLLLQESLIYRVKVTDESMSIGPVIGLLLGIHTDRYNPKHMKKYSDRLGVYDQIGGLIYAFSPKSVNWEKYEAFGLFYNIATKEWEYGCYPLPEVIYRRDFHSSPEYIEKLAEITEGRLFNSYRFSKMELYDYLIKDEELKELLPATELSVNFQQVEKFIDRYQKVILKPIDLSRGRGMCVIEKFASFYQITDYRNKIPSTSILDSESALRQFFDQNKGFFHKYLIQKYLHLAKIGTSIFDIRVVMQKHAGRIWGCTGIECRVSNNIHLTNISRGGYALTLQKTLEKAFEKDEDGLAEKIDLFCHKICDQMDQMGHHFAEFGMDIAVDEQKNIWLIEVNVFPSFKGFEKTDYDTYLKIRFTPLLYALSLTQFNE